MKHHKHFAQINDKIISLVGIEIGDRVFYNFKGYHGLLYTTCVCVSNDVAIFSNGMAYNIVNAKLNSDFCLYDVWGFDVNLYNINDKTIPFEHTFDEIDIFGGKITKTMTMSKPDIKKFIESKRIDIENES